MGAKMKSKRSLGIVAVVLGVVLCSVHVSEAIPMGTAFTYQGFLHEAGFQLLPPPRPSILRG